MLQRGGEVVIRMLADVKQATIGPLIGRTIAGGSVVGSTPLNRESSLAA